jgi:transcriptional regulator with XRE-family HTH domain
MSAIFNDIRKLNLGPHLSRLDCLVLAADDPVPEYVEAGTQLVAALADEIRKDKKMGARDDIMTRSNKLARFFNDMELGEPDDDASAASLMQTMVEKRTNLASSLEITLIHNMVAHVLGIDNFKVFHQDGYFAPYFNLDGFGYAITLRNSQNKGRPFRFQTAEKISSFQAAAYLAKKRFGENDVPVDARAFLKRYADALSGLDIDTLPLQHTTRIRLAKPGHPGDTYRKYRLLSGISQDELAYLVGKNQSSISYYESGVQIAPPEIDKKIRAVLKIPIEFESIGAEYLFYRTEKGLSQSQLAAKIGIPRGSYAHYEADRHTPDAFTDLLVREALGLEQHFFYEGSEYAEARERLGYSVEDVAAKVGIDPQRYVRIETGKEVPRLQTAKRLKQTLDLYDAKIDADDHLTIQTFWNKVRK